MAVYTEVAPSDADALLRRLGLGALTDLRGIRSGIENTNYYATTAQGQWVLTLFERLPREQLPYYLELMRHLAAHGIPVPAPQADEAGSSPMPVAVPIEAAAAPVVPLLGIVVSGELADRRGLLVPYLAGLGLFTLGLVLGGAATSMPMLALPAPKPIMFRAAALPASRLTTCPVSLQPSAGGHSGRSQ